MGNLERFGITDEKEIEAILRLSDYGRKGTPVWKLICSTNWSNIGAKGKYMIAALNRAKEKKRNLKRTFLTNSTFLYSGKYCLLAVN